MALLFLLVSAFDGHCHHYRYQDSDNGEQRLGWFASVVEAVPNHMEEVMPAAAFVVAAVVAVEVVFALHLG